MVKQLRQWQQEAVDAVVQSCARKEHPVVSAIMGAGKSIAIAEIAGRMAASGLYVLVTVPTQQLVRQQAKAMRFWLEEPIGEWYANKKDVQQITVCCHDSLRTLDVFPGRLAWVADECHKTETPTVKDWVARQPTTYRVGFTATPYRADAQETLSLFSSMVYEFGAVDAVAQGVVVPPSIHSAMRDGHIDDLCREWILGRPGKGVVNAATITDAEFFAMDLDANGMPSKAVHSRMGRNEVDDALQWLRDTERGCLVYVTMLSEGFDEPSIEWMCLRRNTGSRVRFAQEVGRGLRAHPGKTHCDIFDPCGLFERHSLSWEACLGPVEEEVDKFASVVEDLEEEESKEEPDAKVVEKLRIKAVSEAQRWLRSTRVDWQMRGLLDLKVTSTHWRSKPPSQKQLDALREHAARLRQVEMKEDTRRKLRLCYKERRTMTKGNISDMLGLIFVAAKEGEWL